MGMFYRTYVIVGIFLGGDVPIEHMSYSEDVPIECMSRNRDILK